MYFNASILASTGNVILVTINYRLGVFGFFTLNSTEARGNYGLWDQIQALKWINENIESFGGDRESVTIFGESAGGFSVSLLALYPANRGLFQRVIAQSGTAHSPYALSPVSVIASKAISNSVGCKPANQQNILTCLRGKSALELLRAAVASPSYYGSPSNAHLTIGMGPVVDGDLIPDSPQRLISDAYPSILGFFKSLDYIAGTTSEEGSLLNALLASKEIQEQYNFNLAQGIPTRVFKNVITRTLVSTYFHNNSDIWKAICDKYSGTTSVAQQGRKAIEMYGDFFFYVPTIQSLLHHSMNNRIGQTFQYVFARDPPVKSGLHRPPWFTGSGHCDELHYLFGLKIKQLQGSFIPDEDLVLTRQMMHYWSNFAKTG